MIYAVVLSSLIALTSVGGLVYVAVRLLDQISGERARHRDEVAELTNKIQYPQIYQPTPTQAAPKPEPPAIEDDWEKVGQIIDDVAEDNGPLPVGEMR